MARSSAGKAASSAGRPSAACDALALAHGEPAGGDYAAFVCSLGLFDADGAPKPAWAAVTSAVASFASP